MKVLMLCKETTTLPFLFLEKKFVDQGDIPGIFFVYPEECMLEPCLYNKYTFHKFKKIVDCSVYDMGDVASDFLEKCTDPLIDTAYLSYIESTYTNYKPLNLQLLSSQASSRAYHYRTKFKFVDDEQQRYWIQICYKKVEEVLSDFNPDYIIDLESSELIRTVVNEVAFVKKIPYITIEHPRFERYKIPTFNLGLGVDDYFLKKYKTNLLLNDRKLVEELEYIEHFRDRLTVMSEEYAGTVTAQYRQDSFIKMIKSIIRCVNYQAGIVRARFKMAARQNIKDCMICSSAIGSVKDCLSYELSRQLLFRHNSYFSIPDTKVNYVYMPLHLIPESTTFVKAPDYIDELHLIHQVSKHLPFGWRLYVKEHQSMLGERPLSFYKKVNQLPNVQMVQLNYYLDPKPWIANSKGVITVTGTSAYEAALLGKKAIVFGSVPFEVLPNVTRVASVDELDAALHSFENDSEEPNNKHACAAYIRTVKDCGVSLNLNSLINDALVELAEKGKISCNHDKEVNALFNFYKKAIHIANEEVNTY